MKKKEALRIKLIRRFYGINGDYDEYKEKEANKIGSTAFMILYWYLLLSGFVVFLFATKYPVETLWIYLCLNMFVLIFVISPYVAFASKKHKLTEVDVEKSDLKKAKKKVILDGIYSGIYFAVVIHFSVGLIGVVIENANFIDFILNFRTIISSVIGGLFFGGFTCLIGLQRLYKIDSDKKD